MLTSETLVSNSQDIQGNEPRHEDREIELPDDRLGNREHASQVGVRPDISSSQRRECNETAIEERRRMPARIQGGRNDGFQCRQRGPRAGYPSSG